MAATESPAVAAARLVGALERCWSAVQAQHRDVPDVVVTIGAGSGTSPQLKLGHFAAGRWRRGSDTLSELFIGGEGLRRGADDLLATVLHEAAHGVATSRNVQDTSRQGRYHNARYRNIGDELGLQLAYDTTRGWSATTLAPDTAARYSAPMADLHQALVAHRLAEPGRGPGVRENNNNGVPALCQCPRKIRVALTVLEAGPIVCGLCKHPFAAAATG